MPSIPAGILQRRARLRLPVPLLQAASPPASGLAIREVRAFPLREPVSRKEYTLVRVTTESGLAGYGECQGVVAAAELQKLLRGRPASAYEAIRQALDSVPAVQGAVNVALLDILGKQAKAPVYQVLGGPTRTRVRVMARLTGDSDGSLRESLTRQRERGFRAFSVPLPHNADAKATRQRIERLREAGEDNDFVLDGGGVLKPAEALRLSAAMEPLHLLWFDEPCATGALGPLRKLAERVTPLGVGRDAEDGAEFQELLREGVVDVLRPDLQRFGITGVRRMAALAETHYVAVAPHHAGGPLGTAAALQLAACLPNFFVQQIPVPDVEADRKMRAALVGGAPLEQARDGYATLPSAAGLGVTVREEALKEYAAS